MKRFYRFLYSLAQRSKGGRLLRRHTSPSVAMFPNPCLTTGQLTLHLRGLRSCPTQVQVLSNTGSIVLEHDVLPLSNNHLHPLTLPTNTPAGMYHCVAMQPSGTSLKSWLALTD